MPIFLWVIRNWKMAGMGIASILCLLALWKVSQWRDKARELDGVKSALSSCEASKIVTKEANDALQRDRDIIAAKLASARRVQPRCVPVASGQPNALKAGAEHARPYARGIRTEWLLDYAAQCETYRSERIVLEKFINPGT